MLFAIEPLPFAPARPRRSRRSMLALLFAPEPLPRDPERAPPRPHTRWLAWLFRPERIDDPDEDSPEVH